MQENAASKLVPPRWATEEASVEGLRLSPFNLGEFSLNCTLVSYQCRLCTQEGEALSIKCFVPMSPSLHNWSIRTSGKKGKDDMII